MQRSDIRRSRERLDDYGQCRLAMGIAGGVPWMIGKGFGIFWGAAAGFLGLILVFLFWYLGVRAKGDVLDILAKEERNAG